MRQTLPDAISVVSNYSESDNLIRNRCGNASRNHLNIGTFKPEDAKRWPELISKISSTCVEKSYEHLRSWCQGGLLNQPNGALESSESDLGSKSVLGTPKSANATPFWIPFGRSWAPFWAPLGAKGSQNQAFWRHFGYHWAKISKRDIQNKASETL